LTVPQSFNGAGIDGNWFTAVAHFAQDTPWLHALVTSYANVIGLLLFALLLVGGWWTARGADNTLMARALAGPVAVLLAYLVNDVVKSLVDENRPCQSLPGVHILEACEAPGDWSFPSNHAAIAGATVLAVWLVSRRLGAVALVCGLLMAAARVYIGAHYPHDVIAGLLLGAVAGAVVSILAGRYGAGLVGRLRGGSWSRLLGEDPIDTRADQRLSASSA
jgi:undecaprenyl-diphosphatase